MSSSFSPFGGGSTSALATSPISRAASLTSSRSMSMASTPHATTTERVVRILQAGDAPSADPDRSARLVECLTKVPDMVAAKTVEIEALIPHMVALLASNNAEVKARVCDFLCLATETDAEVGLLAANVLSQDLSDPNPAIRSTAVATICSLPVLAQHDAVNGMSMRIYLADMSIRSFNCFVNFSAILSALKDTNPLVRKAGVTGCGKVFRHSPQIVSDNGLIDVLYQQVKDPDPSVLTFTLQTLNVILASEGGVVINDNMAKYLLRRLEKMPNMEMCFVLDYLLHYHCRRGKTGADVSMLVLNALDPYFDSKNGPVFLSAVKLFYETAVKMEEGEGQEEEARGNSKLVTDFLRRIHPLTIKFLKASSHPATQDFQIQLLDFVLSMRPLAAAKFGSLLEKDLQIKGKDMTALKKKKLESMLQVREAGDDDAWRSLSNYLVEQMPLQADVRGDIFEALCKIMNSRPSETGFILHEVNRLVKEDEKTYTSLVLSCARMLPASSNSADLSDLLNRVISGPEVMREDLTPDTISNLLWILTHFPAEVKDSPYLLEHLVDSHNPVLVGDREILGQSLFAGVRTFVVRPAATQHTLGRLFELARECGGEEMAKRVTFYSKLLTDRELSKKVLLQL